MDGKKSSTPGLDVAGLGRAIMAATIMTGCQVAAVHAADEAILVSTTADSGPGSLRQAMLDAESTAGADTIRFDSENGPFGPPQTIRLERPLPAITDDLTIDGILRGFLWKPAGVTVDGDFRHRVLEVAPGARVTIGHITVTRGFAEDGGGILNRGELTLKGMSLSENDAGARGGAVANLGGDLWVVNSTFWGNRAESGGALASDAEGRLTVRNATFLDNAGRDAGAISSEGPLLIANTLAVKSAGPLDCLATGPLSPEGGHNIIGAGEGCGETMVTEVPRFEGPDYYNGPTRTFALSGGNATINLGDNALAVDRDGKPLKWDQRHNGDPRFAAGITDIGAFEHQRAADLTVDTTEDTVLMACTTPREDDCPLRAAILLANARKEPSTIVFHERSLEPGDVIVVERPLPAVTVPLVIDGGAVPDLKLTGPEARPLFECGPGGDLTIRDLDVPDDAVAGCPPAPKTESEGP
jgi:CSLREA domain-containing protein